MSRWRLALSALALIAGALVSLRGQGPPAPGRVPQPVMETAASAGFAKVIVGMRGSFAPDAQLDGASRSTQRAEMQAVESRILSAVPSNAIQDVKAFVTIPYFSAEVSVAALTVLAN